MAKDKYVRFDWAAKRMLRNKTNVECRAEQLCENVMRMYSKGYSADIIADLLNMEIDAVLDIIKN